jgi:hypothetical protein
MQHVKREREREKCRDQVMTNTMPYHTTYFANTGNEQHEGIIAPKQ